VGSFDFERFLLSFFGLLFFCYLLDLWVLLLLDDFISFFSDFWSSICASWVLDSKFKLYVFVLSMYSSKGRLRN
jgi:hypothetical protein